MSNITYHRRWAAIPLDLLLNPAASLEAKVLAGLIYAIDPGNHDLLDFTAPLNMTESAIFTALSELKELGIISFNEADGQYDIDIIP